MSQRMPDYEALRAQQARAQEGHVGPCGWRVGPAWKLGGETCACKLGAGHSMPHECTCGSWFEGCGRP